MKFLLPLLLFFVIVSCNPDFLSQGSMESVAIPAPSLKNSIIKNDITQQIGIYLPPSYKSEPKKHYPVVYYLQGYGQKIADKGYACWVLDSLINEKQVPEMIFVDISGRYFFGGSFYDNSPVTGNWEDFVTSDVINYIDNNYRTIVKPEARAITGHSMGGYGALNLGMKHPDIFKVVYGMSPGLFDESGLKNSQLFKDGGTSATIIQLKKELATLSPKEAHEKFLTYKKNIKDWNIEFTLAYGACFAPQTVHAPYFEYPISITDKDTIINEVIWHKWEKGFGDLNNELIQYKENLLQLNYLGLDCGYYDGFEWITEGTKYYAQKLDSLEIPYSINWHTGTHGSRYTQSVRHEMFPNIAAYLEFE